MPTDFKKPGRLDKSRGNHAAQVGSSSTSTRPTTKDTEAKRPQTPNPKYTPAIKGMARNRSESRPPIKESIRSQSGSILSQATKSHGATAMTRPPTLAGVKTPSSIHDRGRLQIPKTFTKGEIPKDKNPSAALRTHDQTAYSGRRDPYYIPSDSEDDYFRGRKLSSVADRGKTTTPSRKTRANSVAPRTKYGSVLSSTSVEVATKPPTPQGPPQKTRVLGESHRNDPSGHPTPKYKSNVRRSTPAKVAGNSTVMTVDDFSNMIEHSPAKPLHPHPTTADGPAPSPRTPSKAPKNAEVISPTGFPSQSREGNPDQVSTPVNPTAKAMGKRSSHSVNGHLKIIEKHTTRALEKTSSTKNSLRANIGREPKRNTAQPKSKGSREASRRIVGSETPSSHRAAIDDVKKIMEVQFEKRAVEKPIPESFFKESEYSDDEYQPSGDEEPSSEDRDSDPPSFPGSTVITSPSPVEGLKSSRPNPSRTLRRTYHPKPQASFTPIDRLVPVAQERGSSPRLPIRPSKFGRGYTKRVRDAFSDASSSHGSEDETNGQVDSNTTIQSSQDRKGDDDEPVVAQPSDSTKKPRWSPRSWMERYETEFMPGRDGSVWLATGPFKGWILDGPRAGGYIPGCREPDDETVAEAEKTAKLRWNLRWADSESDYISDTGDSDYEEVSTGHAASVIHEDAASTHVQQFPVENSFPKGSQDVPEKASPRIDLNNKIVERAERTERTKQYVLAGGSSNNVDSQPKKGLSEPVSSRTRGKFPAYLAPATAPQDAPSPPSAESETTSTLITQQFINDCAPPSNQELAELMSSSPAIRRADTSPPAHKVDESDDSSSSESSSGIPAHISPKPPARSSDVPRTQGACFGPEHVNAAHILGGIAERRTTRSLTSILPSTAESNKFAHDTRRASADTEPESSRQPKKDSSKTNIVVEVPGLSTEEQEEYEVVSSTPETRPTLSPKSFKEINEATSGVDIESNDPDAEQALDYVLRQSPRWLTSVTENKEAEEIVTRVPEPLSKYIVTRSAQDTLQETAKPTSLDSNSEVPCKSSPIPSKTAAPNPASSLSAASKKEGNSAGHGETKKRRKRKASNPDPSIADESALKKQKTDDNQSLVSTGRQIDLRRKRREKRRRRRQQKHNRSQQHAGHVIGSGAAKDMKRGSQSTMTPPSSSRPTSSEAK